MCAMSVMTSNACSRLTTSALRNSRIFSDTASDEYQHFSGSTTGHIATVTPHCPTKGQEIRQPVTFAFQPFFQQGQKQQRMFSAVLECCRQRVGRVAE